MKLRIVVVDEDRRGAWAEHEFSREFLEMPLDAFVQRIVTPAIAAILDRVKNAPVEL